MASCHLIRLPFQLQLQGYTLNLKKMKYKHSQSFSLYGSESL